MNIIFAGTPDFSAKILRTLIDSKHNIRAVLTQPDRPKGRGRKLTASPVKLLSADNYIDVLQPRTLKSEDAQSMLAELEADVMVVVAYGLILPKAVLSLPTKGCINIHASLLPKYRGAAPIQAAILNGDSESGVTVMQMNEGLDTGDMLYKATCMLVEDETSLSLHDKLADLGSKALLETLSLIDSNKLEPVSQNNQLATYAGKIQKNDALINWNESAVVIERRIRAYNPWPIAYTQFSKSERLRVFKANVLDGVCAEKPAGTVLSSCSQGLDIACGEGVIRIEQLQFSGGTVIGSESIKNACAQKIPLTTVLG